MCEIDWNKGNKCKQNWWSEINYFYFGIVKVGLTLPWYTQLFGCGPVNIWK